MENVSKGAIRKITVGVDPLKNGKAYAIKSEFDLAGQRCTIVNIVHDMNYFHKTGREKYAVYMRNSSNNVFVWIEIIDEPVIVEYYDPKENPMNLV